MITVYVKKYSSFVWFLESYKIGYKFVLYGKTLEISNEIKSMLYDYCKPMGINIDLIIRHDYDESLSEDMCKWEVYKEGKNERNKN